MSVLKNAGPAISRSINPGRRRSIIQVATERTVIGDFVKNNVLTINGKTTTMSAKDGQYFITTTGEDGQENTYKIIYTIGSKWKQRYLTEFDNGEYHILPVSSGMWPRNAGRIIMD